MLLLPEPAVRYLFQKTAFADRQKGTKIETYHL